MVDVAAIQTPKRSWPESLCYRTFFVLVCLLLALAASAHGKARVEGDWIVVEGEGNTLETVARDVGNEKVFSFDEETGYALSARSLRVVGELAIGGEATTGSLFRFVNSLEFDVGQCGQARIQVVSSDGGQPRLQVENARIATLRTDEGNDACKSEGNPIEVKAGRFILRSSTVTGNFVVRVAGGEVEIADASVTTSNHAGVSLAGLRAKESQISGLRSLDHQIYGMEVGPLEGPLTLVDCLIRGGGADFHVRGRAALTALDCDFDSIRFAGQEGSVRRQWTVTVRTPGAGCRVEAESEKGAGAPERVEATADSSGTARLALTEYTARADGFDYLRRGENDSTPHRLTVLSPDGQTALGRLGNYRVLTRGQEVRLP